MSAQFKIINITGADQYSDSLVIGGLFNFSLSGAWVGTVTVQRSFDNGITWLDVATFNANGEYIGREIEDSVRYRFGVKTGDYDSGTIIGRLSQ